MKEPIGSGVFAHWKNTRCNGCDKIVAHPPQHSNGGRGNTGGQPFYCSEECKALKQTREAEEPRGQFDKHSPDSLLIANAGGGRRVKAKGRR